ncbi:alpha/beta hydrolase [Kitasatospora sp. NBC_00240]|uniref:alpha/beta fold hydrolase n=1 Tax=Kitasatospora sp. NBC_00240 TaxID=2903567 RepID=UPI00225592C6|nr:alpha/beta hydrolase [Kitasatospora sp. NBC_00240]MCX5213804.1 alpha/beta hydrolase [Kitasatospora sp. NBC_00240]
MTTAVRNTLSVPGAMLHYELRGTGPLLLVAQSGEGDADRTEALVGHLADRYTVATYDRRGLSRSTRLEAKGPVTPQTHAEDLHHLLAALTDRPALLLGCSLGALYGLHLVAAHPDQVRTLVAHDPATPGLLPATDRAGIRRTLDGIVRTHRSAGWAPAMRRIAEAVAIDPAAMETEPGFTMPATTARRIANIEFFLSNDLPELRDSTLCAADLAAPATRRVRIVPAAGRTSGQAWNYRCAEELAALLGTDIVEFPGGHNGNTTHPRAFAARLHEVLDASR